MRNLFKNKYFWTVTAIIIISLSLMHFTSSYRGEISIVEKAVRDAYTPLQSGVVEFKEKLADVGTFFSSKSALIEQNEILTQENAELKQQNQRLREAEKENDRLRKLIGFQDISILKYELVPARVIARSPSNWYMYLVIDKGENDGIEKNMAVISPEGLVGRVASVSRTSSHIDLITHREVAVGAVVQETRDTRGIVEGLGDSNMLKMANIPYYSVINVGDHVITSGLSEIFPKGIDVGRVTEVKPDPGGLLLSASIEPEVNFDRLEEVLVVTAAYQQEPEDNSSPQTVEQTGE